MGARPLGHKCIRLSSVVIQQHVRCAIGVGEQPQERNMRRASEDRQQTATPHRHICACHLAICLLRGGLGGDSISDHIVLIRCRDDSVQQNSACVNVDAEKVKVVST